MKSVFVQDLASGQSVTDDQFVLGGVAYAQDKNGRTYANLTLVDRTGSIAAKMWSEALERNPIKETSVGKIVEVSGVVQEYKGSRQMTVLEIKQSEEGSYSIGDFRLQTTKDLELLKSRIVYFISKIQDEDLHEFVQDFFAEYQEQFLSSAAAKINHHHYFGGLAEHIVEMLDMAEVVVRHYPEANSDLVYVGIILHDCGKFIELSSNGFTSDYTVEGKLIGHISLGVRIVEDYLAKYPKKYQSLKSSGKLLLINHMILSHQGQLEYGSPVVPKLIESIIVYGVDELSFKARAFQRVLAENANSQEDFSRRDYALDTEVYLKVDKILKRSPQTTLL